MTIDRGARTRTIHALVLAGVVLAHATTARAYEERVSLELGTGYALAPVDLPRRYHGVPVFAASSIGFGERWSLDLSAGYLGLFGDGAHHFGLARVEAGFALDVIQIVPRLSFGVASVVTHEPEGVRGDVGPTLRIGFDRLTGFGLVGVDLRGTVFGFGATSAEHFVLELGLRIGYLVDRF